MTNLYQWIKDGLTGLFPSTRRRNAERDCELLLEAHEKPAYTIEVDYGIPYSIKCKSKDELEAELKALRAIADNQENPYFDVHVYDQMDRDISETQLIEELSSAPE
jgi:hypothetical protein